MSCSFYIQCQECNDDNCTKCNPQHYLENGNCYRCVLPNCTECISNSKCTKCSSNTFLLNNKCVPYPENCQNVDKTTGKCSLCNNNYYRTESNLCSPCNISMPINSLCQCQDQKLKNCSSCNKSTCQKCIQNHKLVNGICEKNSYETAKNCSQAQFCQNLPNTPNHCISCPKNQFCSKEFACISCSKNCSKCDSEKVCTECEAVFALKNGVCETKKECSESVLCVQGSFCNGELQCEKCSERCRECSEKSCMMCEDGFKVVGQGCQVLKQGNFGLLVGLVCGIAGFVVIVVVVVVICTRGKNGVKRLKNVEEQVNQSGKVLQDE